MKIHQTRNYGMFVPDAVNRPITEHDHSRLNRLREKMKKYGFLPCFCLWCVPLPDGKRKVKDGQHRLAIAEELSLPVYYMDYDRDDIQSSDLGGTSANWSLSDFVYSYAAQGKPDYKELIEFQQEHGLSLGTCASILYGYSANSGSVIKMVRTGDYTVRDRKGAKRIVAIIEAISRHVDWAINKGSVGAISRFVHVKEFNDEQFISKIDQYPAMLTKQPTIDMFTDMFDALYNYCSKSKIPLSFMAKQDASRRGDIAEINKSRRRAAPEAAAS